MEIDTRFAVLLCTHNGEKYLQEQLASLTAQTLRPAVIFIHDWGSTDRTLLILREFESAYRRDFHISVVEHLSADGPKASFVEGIKLSLTMDSFDYLMFCDQDDIWHLNKLEKISAKLRAQDIADQVSILFSDVRVVDAVGNVVASSYYRGYSPFLQPWNCADPGVLFANPCIGMTMAVERKFLDKIISSLDGPWMMHDWAVLLLGAALGKRIEFLPDALVDYRQHAGNHLGGSRQGRIVARLKKARAHVGLLRLQLNFLVSCVSVDYRSELVVAARGSRIRLAALVSKSTILRWPGRWLLTGLLWALW